MVFFFFFFQAEDGIRDYKVTGVQTCALPIWFSAEVSLEGREPAERALCGERGARAVVSTSPESLARLHTIAAQYQLQAREIGTVTRGEFRVQYNGRVVVNAAVESLRDAWARALERALTTR